MEEIGWVGFQGGSSAQRYALSVVAATVQGHRGRGGLSSGADMRRANESMKLYP